MDNPTIYSRMLQLLEAAITCYNRADYYNKVCNGIGKEDFPNLWHKYYMRAKLQKRAEAHILDKIKTEFIQKI